MAQRKDRGDHTFLPARGDRLYVQVSFKEFGGDYEQAIRGQKDDAQVYSLANKAIVREGLELWVAKDTLLQLRDQCLEKLSGVRQIERVSRATTGRRIRARSRTKIKCQMAWVGHSTAHGLADAKRVSLLSWRK